MLVRRRPIDPAQAAADFLVWLHGHRLSERSWTVDEVWYLASADFAPAHALVLPPRNRFLGALQKVSSVRVQYDKRVRIEGKCRKTTVYTFYNSGAVKLAA